MQMESIDGATGMAQAAGVRREVSLTLVEGVAIGDYVLVHAGFAIQRVDEKRAEETLKLLGELEIEMTS
jgi:hydrogenase expression/formation protein HypC